MPELAITRWIDAPVESVWNVLDDYGNIQRWSPSIKRSFLTSPEPIGVGTTRHCDFTVGSATERIETYEPNRRLAVRLTEMEKMPLTDARADFQLRPSNGGTEVIFRYSYTPNRLGRLLGGVIKKMMARTLGDLITGLQHECEGT